MLVLECNYSKKVGLPGYSSHQFMVTLRTEVSDLNNVQAESERLYGLLQNAVDSSLQRVGWLPEAQAKNGNGHGNGHGQSKGRQEQWQCSDKQRDLLLNLTAEHRLDKSAVEQLAQERFGKGVRSLNKLEMSGLLDELIEQTGGNGRRGRRFGRPVPAGAA
jgi:hypothetical protein